MKEKTYDILGVGTPLLDHLIHVDETFLAKLSGKKYGMETISHQEMIDLIEKSGTVPKMIAGGSCANAIKGLCALGRKCALTGKIGTDSYGQKVVEDLEDKGVTPLLHYTETPTAHVICLITQDGKRTCRAYLGAATEMRPEDLIPEHFDNVRLVHIEGYSLLYPGLTRAAMELAKQKGALISFDLGSFEVVETYKPLVRELLQNFVDITFANEDEAFALTKLPPKDACAEIQKHSSVAIVMIGKEGCWIKDQAKYMQCPAYPITPIDTTGAGDLFACGFLHAYLDNKSLEECARWGAIVSRAVVQEIGAEISDASWRSIQKLLGTQRKR